MIIYVILNHKYDASSCLSQSEKTKSNVFSVKTRVYESV